MNYEKLVYSICYKMSGNTFDAQDLTQETFLSAYKKLPEFDGAYEKAWICRIATNKCLDFLKNSARKMEPTEDTYFQDLSDKQKGPEENYLNQEANEKLLSICKMLKPPYDQIAIGHFYEEKTAKEIAEEQGKNLKTVQTQIYRAKAMLRKQMKGGHRG